MTPTSLKSPLKDERVGVGETGKNAPQHRRVIAGSSPHKASQCLARDVQNRRYTGHAYDANEAFKKLTKLIKRGTVSPSRTSLEKWCSNEYGIKPVRRDVEAWQGTWLMKGVIEPSKTPNGKGTYKLKVKNVLEDNHEQ